MIRRVKIQGYKSLRDIEIQLEPLTVIFGANAAGKSNLFDALALLSRLVQGYPLSQAFEQHRGDPVESFYYGDSSLPEKLTLPRVAFSITVDVALSSQSIEMLERSIQQHNGEKSPARHLRYKILIQMVRTGRRLSIIEESLVAIDKDGNRLQEVEPFISEIPSHKSARPEWKGTQSIDIPREAERTLASLAAHMPGYPHIVAFQDGVAAWQFHYLEPKRMMRREAALKYVTVLDSYGEDLAAYYYTLKELKPRQFDAINKALSSLLPRLTVEVQATDEGRLELKIREGSATYSVRTVSEGTLRLLGTLAALNPLTHVSTVGLEEPENGVHPRRLAWIAEMARNAAQTRDMQLLLTTHSPTLPGMFDESSLLICHKKGAETVFEPFAPRYSLEPIQESETEGETTFTERVLRGDFGG